MVNRGSLAGVDGHGREEKRALEEEIVAVVVVVGVDNV